jgi:uncharacterized protein (DUF305 family)
MTHTALNRLIAALLVGVVGLSLSACGSEEEEKLGSPTSDAAKRVKAVEGAFLTTMVPHHESAIEMAEVAKEKGKDRFVTKLADDILTSQEREIARMEAIHERLFGTKLEPDPGGHDRLGLTAAEAGMTHDAQTIKALRTAEPFDRAFVDAMVPHHEGAIKMANVVLKSTRDGELRKLARTIVSTQQHEIEQMNAFRTRRFGGPVRGDGAHEEHPMKRGKRDKDEKHGAGHPG